MEHAEQKRVTSLALQHRKVGQKMWHATSAPGSMPQARLDQCHKRAWINATSAPRSMPQARLDQCHKRAQTNASSASRSLMQRIKINDA
eukprot:1159635-Pelagomonas_calceolata.AAC.13